MSVATALDRSCVRREKLCRSGLDLSQLMLFYYELHLFTTFLPFKSPLFSAGVACVDDFSLFMLFSVLSSFGYYNMH